MSDPILQAGQYSIDGLVFGVDTFLPISLTTLSPGNPLTQDVALVGHDGRRFGEDYLPGMSIGFTGQSLVQGEETPGPATLDAYEQFSLAWNNPVIRKNSEAVSILRLFYPGSQVVRRVYGRGRLITPTLGFVKQGWLGFVADFDAADNTFYSDVQQQISLGTAQATTGGVAPPLTPPVVLASSRSTVNMFLPSDADFELPWTGNWQASSLISVLDRDNAQADSGTWSMLSVISNPGTASFYYAPLFSVIAGRSYYFSFSVRPGSGMSGDGAVTATFYDSFGQPVGSPVSFLSFTSVSGSFTKFTGNFVVPSGANQVELSFEYTPASAGSVWWDSISLVGDLAFSWSAYNAGTQDTWPTIALQGPATNPSIAYPGRSARIMLKTTIAANQIAVIQTAPWKRSVGITTSLALDALGDVPIVHSLAGYLRGNDLDSMVLPPGVTEVGYQSQDTSGRSRAILAWRNAWGTIGGSTQ